MSLGRRPIRRFDDPWTLAALARQTERVRELCEDVGYGRVMHDAERLWRERELSAGRDGGIVHTIGACASYLVACACAEPVGAVDGPCDWCCGSGRVTKRVREAIRQLA